MLDSLKATFFMGRFEPSACESVCPLPPVPDETPGYAAARLLRRQRDFPLPRTVVRRPALRARRRARRGMAADCFGCAGVRGVASTLAPIPGTGPRRTSARSGAGPGIRRHEYLLLSGDRS